MFRVVSVYQPCKNERDAGSVYRQHKRWLQENNDDRCPRLAFRQDFKKELRKWIQMGDQIVVSGDVNESVFHPSIAELLENNEFNMRNLIFDVHDSSNAPRTYGVQRKVTLWMACGAPQESMCINVVTWNHETSPGITLSYGLTSPMNLLWATTLLYPTCLMLDG